MSNQFKTKFFPTTNELNAWNVYTQSWTGRIPARRAHADHQLMASLPESDRQRIARLASRATHD
jgi:hypothetical protein